MKTLNIEFYYDLIPAGAVIEDPEAVDAKINSESWSHASKRILHNEATTINVYSNCELFRIVFKPVMKFDELEADEGTEIESRPLEGKTTLFPNEINSVGKLVNHSIYKVSFIHYVVPH